MHIKAHQLKAALKFMYFSVNLSLVYHSVMNVMISRSMRMFPTSPSLLLSSPTPL